MISEKSMPLTARSLRTVAAALAMLAALALPTLSSAQPADIQDAVDVVSQFFTEHSERFDIGEDPLLNDAEAARRYLVDGLAVEGLQGLLQFDPVFDGQDADIANLSIGPDPDIPLLQGAARVRVSFTNFGAQRTMTYTLIKAPDGIWQISDIYSDEGGWSLANMMHDMGIGTRTDPSTEVTLAGGGQTSGDTADPDFESGMEEGDLPGNGIAEGGSDLLFVLDASGSMWGQIDGVAKITTAKQALTALIGDLAPETNVGLMAYGHRREGDCSDTEILYPVFNYDTNLLKPVIEAITPRGKTPIAAALQQAAEAMPQSRRPANVLLISDGLETCGGDPCAAAKALAEQGINTRVHVVGFDLTQEENAALQCIADNGGGNYYAANDAESFVEAVNQAVSDAEADTAPSEPEPAPSPTPVAQAIFEETFDGPALDPSWQTVNPAENLTAFTGDGALFVSALEDDTSYDDKKALNRLVLDQPLPEGDFDLALDFRILQQTGYEQASVSVEEDANNQLAALAWVYTKGCGSYLNLSLIKLSGSGDGKPEKANFDTNLFGGPILKNSCNAGDRAYGNKVLEALGTSGATLLLKRRGRSVTAAIEMELPEGEGRPSEPFSFETEPMTVLRLSGKPSVIAGQWEKGRPGESHFEFDRFVIEAPED